MSANLSDFTEEQLDMALLMVRYFKRYKIHPAEGFEIIILWETQILNALNEVKGKK